MTAWFIIALLLTFIFLALRRILKFWFPAKPKMKDIPYKPMQRVVVPDEVLEDFEKRKRGNAPQITQNVIQVNNNTVNVLVVKP